MKILLADDRVENRYLGQSILENAGFEVVTAANGAEALDKARHDKFDLIVSDIMMPKMDGFQFCRELKHDEQLNKVPFVFYTATYTDAQDEAFARRLGAQDFIVKPVEPEIFLRRIRSVVQNAPAVPQSQATPDEIEYFKEYSHRLVQKLEQKIAEVEAINSELKNVNGTLEERIREKTQSLETKNRELEAFAYSVAHDLRAPLRALNGLSHALLEEYAHCLDATGEHYANRIIKAAERMDTLIRDLLAYSRMAQAVIPISNVSLETVVDEVCEQLGPLLHENKTALEVERPLPSVSGNGQALHQVISNLLVNAMKFVAPGVQPRVRIRAEEKPNLVRLFVEDNGIGIDAEHQSRIFQMFERLHQKEYPGTGVGLALVQKAVDRMNGKVGVSSMPGKGSTFWIELSKPV